LARPPPNEGAWHPATSRRRACRRSLGRDVRPPPARPVHLGEPSCGRTPQRWSVRSNQLVAHEEEVRVSRAPAPVERIALVVQDAGHGHDLLERRAKAGGDRNFKVYGPASWVTDRPTSWVTLQRRCGRCADAMERDHPSASTRSIYRGLTREGVRKSRRFVPRPRGQSQDRLQVGGAVQGER